MAQPVLEIKPQESKVRKSTPNILPCRIHHTGAIERTEQFWSPEESKDAKKTAYFRGRKLHGRSVKVPEGYRGAVVETHEPVSNGHPAELDDLKGEQQEREIEMGTIELKAEFNEIVIWGHGASVDAATDPYVRGMEEWLAVSEQIHSYTSDSKQS